MGFIDYSGTKEDCFEEVVDYARSLKEEEKHRLRVQNNKKWLEEALNDKRYSELSLEEQLKQIITKYRQLILLKDELIENNDLFSNLDFNVLWSDFGIYIITSHIKPFNLENEKRDKYYKTFMEKVFKFQNSTPVEVHYDSICNNKRYQKYFRNTFEIIGEKNFWKLIANGCNKKQDKLDTFLTTYKALSCLLGYYFYSSLEPDDDTWQNSINVEQEAINSIREEYKNDKIFDISYSRLKNPLYYGENEANIDNWMQEGISEGKNNIETAIEAKKPLILSSKQEFHREHFDELISKENIEDYIEACKILYECNIPENVSELFVKLIEKLIDINKTIAKFNDVYIPDMYQFNEYYIPETLLLSATYVEYAYAEIGDKIIKENEHEVVSAINKLILAINCKIDEIYKYASIEAKAKAKALDSIISQNGYVDPKYSIN